MEDPKPLLKPLTFAVLPCAVQLKVAVGILGWTTMLVSDPEQIWEVVTEFVMTGFGLTVRTKFTADPAGQPAADGVTAYVTNSIVFPELLTVWLILLPVPFEKPLRFPDEGVAVQLKLVPMTCEKIPILIVSPEQMVCAGIVK